MHVAQLQRFFKYEPCGDDPQVLVDDIVHQARRYLPPEQVKKIQQTYEYARAAHGDQARLSGEIYITHPLKATLFLMDMKPDIATIQACILHDVIEDTPITHEDIESEFGQEIATLCEGLVKVSTVRYRGEERQLETIKKTFLAMAHDLRVIFIKIADRIHNIQTLKYHPKPEKQQRIAEETMMIYVPIAKKLGLYRYQLLLENGAFMMLHPKECKRIMKYLEKNFGGDRTYIYRGQRKIETLLKKENISYRFVKGRVKSPYRIFEKMQRKKEITVIRQVMDIIAFRIVTENVGGCYNILGAIHHSYTPMIKKIKDYISIPKSNGYQSLHTTVIGMFRFPVEIQIRTQTMDDIAEYGVAAHFVYSDRHEPDAISDSQAAWIKKLQDLVSEYQVIENKESFKKELNLNILSKSVFLYTPKGDIFELPQGSTVLDFAFRIHTDLGLSFKSAIVNGVIKPIGYKPQSGDIIDIKAYRNKVTATKYRSDFLYTSGAKSKLQRHLRKQQKDMIVAQSLKKLNSRLLERRLPTIGSDDDQIRKLYKEEERERLLIAMYDKQESYTLFFKEAYPERRAIFNAPSLKTPPTEQSVIERVSQHPVIDHIHTLSYRLCPTCKPTAADKIIAKSGRDGIVIHTTSCKGVETANTSSLLEAHRNTQPVTTYSAHVCISVEKPQYNLPMILTMMADFRISIDSIQINEKTHTVTIATHGTNPGKFDLLRQALKKHQDFHTIQIKGIA